MNNKKSKSKSKKIKRRQKSKSFSYKKSSSKFRVNSFRKRSIEKFSSLKSPFKLTKKTSFKSSLRSSVRPSFIKKIRRHSSESSSGKLSINGDDDNMTGIDRIVRRSIKIPYDTKIKDMHTDTFKKEHYLNSICLSEGAKVLKIGNFPIFMYLSVLHHDKLTYIDDVMTFLMFQKLDNVDSDGLEYGLFNPPTPINNCMSVLDSVFLKIKNNENNPLATKRFYAIYLYKNLMRADEKNVDFFKSLFVFLKTKKNIPLIKTITKYPNLGLHILLYILNENISNINDIYENIHTTSDYIKLLEKYSEQINITKTQDFSPKRYSNISISEFIRQLNSVSHASVLLIDTFTKEVEYYDPHGSCCSDGVNDIIKSYFTNKNGFYYKNYKNIEKPDPYSYINFSDYCDEKSTQYIQGDMFRDYSIKLQLDPAIYSDVGYCLIWSNWYLDMRLSNLNVDRKQLLRHIHSLHRKHPKLSATIIQSYWRCIEEFIKYKLDSGNLCFDQKDAEIIRNCRTLTKYKDIELISQQ